MAVVAPEMDPALLKRFMDGYLALTHVNFAVESKEPGRSTVLVITGRPENLASRRTCPRREYPTAAQLPAPITEQNHKAADFLHTFPDEVELMWPTPLSIPKVLFFALRYYLLVHHVFAVLYGQIVGLGQPECHTRFIRLAISAALTVVTSESILFVRVYAFSGRNRKMFWYLVFQFAVIHAPALMVLIKFIQSVEFDDLPLTPDMLETMPCIPTHMEAMWLGALFGLLLCSVAVMLIMVRIAYRKHRDFNNTLLVVFYRDGVYYFICLSILASANIFINFLASEGYKFLFIQAEVDIHVILSTRMLLHLREWATRGGKLGRVRGVFGRKAAVDTDDPSTLEQLDRDGYPPSTRAPSTMRFQAPELLSGTNTDATQSTNPTVSTAKSEL